MQPKLQRIFSTLKQAKTDGVKEIDLMEDLETSNNARVIRFKLNKILGKGTVKTVDGIWYLDKAYWEVTPAEFRDIVIVNELEKARYTVFWAVATAVILSVLLGTLMYFTLEFSY